VVITDTRLGASTDSTGAYTIKAVPSGTYRLKGFKVGYKTCTLDSVNVGLHQVVKVGFRLAKADLMITY